MSRKVHVDVSLATSLYDGGSTLSEVAVAMSLKRNVVYKALVDAGRQLRQRGTRRPRRLVASTDIPGCFVVPLTKGLVSIIDEQDVDRVALRTWLAKADDRGNFYAKSCVRLSDGRKTFIRLHNYIMSPAIGMIVDHRNGNGLDNRRCNLRVCLHKENIRNMRKHRGSLSSKFKGVSFDRKRSAWMASITVDRTSIKLGSFNDEESAAIAYDAAARRYFGQFARVNFPSEGEVGCTA